MKENNLISVDSKNSLNLKKFHIKNREILKQDFELYTVIGPRNLYLFDWILYMHENAYLPSINDNYLTSLCCNKTRIAIYVTIIDDYADSKYQRNCAMLEILGKIPFEKQLNLVELNLNKEEQLVVRNTKMIWDKIESDVFNYPRYDELKELFKFDLQQIVNSMHYAYLVNSLPGLGNQIENDFYHHYSMTVLAVGTMDLMCSLDFDLKELGKIRKVLYYAQKAAKIGNIINTYPKEFNEMDLSSYFVIAGLEKGLIDIDTLLNQDFSMLKKKSREIIKELRYDYSELNSMIKDFSLDIESIELTSYIEGLEFIFEEYNKRVNYWESEYENQFYIE